MMEYLFTASVAFTILFIAYQAVFKHLTFFQLNRVYLLFIGVFSLVAPLLSFQMPSAWRQGLFVIELPILNVSANALTADSGQINWLMAVSVLYLIGLIVSGYVFARSLVKIYTLKAVSGENEEDYLIAEGSHAFSFFNRIQIGSELDPSIRQMIFDHEKIHREQYHSIDVMFYALLRVFFWFNPFVYLAFKEVEINHEYIADGYAHKEFGSDYQHTILNMAMDTNVFPLTNSFIKTNTIKNRIIMMNKPRSNARYRVWYMMALPIAISAIWVSACTQQTDLPQVNTNSKMENAMKSSAHEGVLNADQVEVMAQFPGGNEGLLAYYQEGFKYPEELKADGVEGKVYLSFIVNADGTLSDFEAVKWDDERLVEPALKFAKGMPSWVPGEKDGAPVKVKMFLPIQYTLN